jgi:salicylate hydroxylase
MVPFQAQGAAQAILDAAVLGDALAGATSAEACHLADGPESQTRNARMAAYGAEDGFSPRTTAWTLDVLDEKAAS